MNTHTLPTTLLAAWRDLTPRHQALVLTMMQALADEDRAIGENPATASAEATAREPGSADFATMIRNLAMQGSPPTPEPNAWLQSVGMFNGNAAMDEIWEAGRRIREAERDEQC